MIEKMPEGAIEFGSGECCAIAHAFAKNKNTVTALKEAIGQEKLKAFASILVNTKNMAFLPSPESKIAYEQIIRAELSRLENEKEAPSFHCKHSKEEHIGYLNLALEKVKTPVV